jgi:hypothetical protein
MQAEPEARGGDTGKNEGKSPNETLIEHADRMWQAERENAGRIADRINILAGGTIALLGIGLFNVDWLVDVESVPLLHPFFTGTIHALLLLALLLFARALVVL